MSDDILRWMKDNDARLRQTETKEVPGASGFSQFYVTGAFTPAFGGSGGNGTISYDTQFGRYTRIGNVVIARFQINTNTVTVKPTGNLQITGLPIIAANVTQPGATTLGDVSNIDLTAGNSQYGVRVNAAATTANLTQSGDNIGASFLQGTAMTGNDVEVTGVLIYEV